MIHILSKQNSIANRFVAELRDVNIQQDRLRFRRNLERLGEVFAYEISKTLDYEEQEVETPMGIAHTQLPNQRIVLLTILRAGLPLHQGLLNYFDAADNGFISAYRMHHKDGSFEINLQAISCPNLSDAIVVLSDPMLATGASLGIAIEKMMEYGTPKKIHVVTAIASSYGLDYLKRRYPKAEIWMGDLDDELTAKSYIVPGLGDAGDLAFGSKVQE
ncbi:MAG: uracil phosphoribosyltransferase [Bacteroidota bacterium]